MIYLFNTSGSPKISEVGGKGFSLVQMAQANLPVPPGFICSVAFFEPWLKILQALPEWTAVQDAIINEENLASTTTSLTRVCSDLTLTVAQEDLLSKALQPFPSEVRFAIRFSPIEIDLEGTPFPSSHKTTLGIRETSLLEALRDSFLSSFDEAVIDYKQKHNKAIDQLDFAVIVQQQITGVCSGKAYSINPLNNDFDEAVVQVTSGLADNGAIRMESSDIFVIDKLSNSIVGRQLGREETSVSHDEDINPEKNSYSSPIEISLADNQVLKITPILKQVDELLQHPGEIKWISEDDRFYLLNASPTSSFIPLPSEMLTKPGERRLLYRDVGLTEGITINKPVTPLTLDWRFGLLRLFIEPFIGPVDLQTNKEPSTSLIFAAAGQIYVNVSQLLTIISSQRLISDAHITEAPTFQSDLYAQIDEDRYKAKKKISPLRWPVLMSRIPRTLWYSRHFVWNTISALWNPERFFRKYDQLLNELELEIKQSDGANISLRNYVEGLYDHLTPFMGDVSFPALISYLYQLSRLDNQIAYESQENQRLVDSMKMGYDGKEEVDIGIQMYRLANMLSPPDFADIDKLVLRLEKRDLPANFMAAWDEFIAKYGLRGPGESELVSPRYGDDWRLALEQMSYLIDSSIDPESMHNKRIIERKQASKRLVEKYSGSKRNQVQKICSLIDLMWNTRDTPKHLTALASGAVRNRALQEGQRFVQQDRLDVADDIFWLTLDEIDKANSELSFNLRRVCDDKKSSYQMIEQVQSFPHLIDSRGRIGQVNHPLAYANRFTGLGVSQGYTTGHVKLLNHPLEKPVMKEDVLVAYTTDIGWTPLFANAKAVILEVGDALGHGAVVAREFGVPCVTGVQGITSTLQDGQLVEVDGTSGVIRLLSE